MDKFLDSAFKQTNNNPENDNQLQNESIKLQNIKKEQLESPKYGYG